MYKFGRCGGLLLVKINGRWVPTFHKESRSTHPWTNKLDIEAHLICMLHPESLGSRKLEFRTIAGQKLGMTIVPWCWFPAETSTFQSGRCTLPQSRHWLLCQVLQTAFLQLLVVFGWKRFSLAIELSSCVSPPPKELILWTVPQKEENCESGVAAGHSRVDRWRFCFQKWNS